MLICNIEHDELIKILSTYLGFEIKEIKAQVKGGNPGKLPKLERILLEKKR